MGVAVLERYWVLSGPVLSNIEPYSRAHLNVVSIALTFHSNHCMEASTWGVMVRSDFQWCPFNVWAQWPESPIHDKPLPYGIPVVLFPLIERLAPVAYHIPIIQIAVVLVWKENSPQCICRCIDVDHLWFVRLRNDNHRRFDQLRLQHVKGI